MTSFSRLASLASLASLALIALLGGCSSDPSGDPDGGQGGASGVSAQGAGGASGQGGASGTAGTAGSAGGAIQLGNGTATCAQAASAQSYLGCEFWPTVTFNPVWSIFDFAVVVANTGTEASEVTLEGPAGSVEPVTVPPLGLVKVYLPWVAGLKGKDFDSCGSTEGQAASAFVAKGAYHLTSSRPVIVYQFSALEFRGAGGPAGKSWDSCPGNQPCDTGTTKAPIGCFSFSNDASLLLPTSAMTGNYTVTTLPAGNSQSFFAITGTADATTVKVKLKAAAQVLAGGLVKAPGPDGVLTLKLGAGDVVEVVAASVDADLSGSLVQADQPIQLLAGAGCASLPRELPDGTRGTCDHLEETVLPIETLGKRYFVTAPTGALGTPVSQVVRLFGSVDGTKLTYPSGQPKGAPATIGAGESVDLGIVAQDFEVVADQAIAVSTFLLSAELSDPDDLVSRGDPSQSQAVTVDQFRSTYVFLAPDDYDVSFVDVVMPLEAEVTIDEAPLPTTPSPIGASGFGVARVRLGSGQGGAHTLRSNRPVGIQVLGYGSYTSYQYPGGLDLRRISPPLPPIE